MSDKKSVGQVLIEQYAKNEMQKRESYDRYMYRKYQESRAQTKPTLEERVEDIKKRYDELSKRVEKLEKLEGYVYSAPAEEWDKKKD